MTQRIVPEVHTHKGCYVSVEELTKSRVALIPLSSPNPPLRRIEYSLALVHKGRGDTNFPGRSHTRGRSAGDAEPSRRKLQE